MLVSSGFLGTHKKVLIKNIVTTQQVHVMFEYEKPSVVEDRRGYLKIKFYATARWALTLSEIRHTRTNTAWFHLHRVPRREKFTDRRSNKGHQRLGHVCSWDGTVLSILGWVKAFHWLGQKVKPHSLVHALNAVEWHTSKWSNHLFAWFNPNKTSFFLSKYSLQHHIHAENFSVCVRGYEKQKAKQNETKTSQ